MSNTNNDTLEINPNTEDTNLQPNDPKENISDTEFKNAVENNSEIPADKAEAIDHNNNNEVDSALLDKLFEELKSAKDSNSTINVKITSMAKGGYKALYNELPVFLPFSHFSLTKNLSDEELNDAVGKEFSVNVYDLQEDESKRKTVIVSRKKTLEDNFWGKYKLGDIVEGPVTSVAAFGIFIDLGGNEGLIHISRLSNNRVADTKSFAQKGDILKAKIIELSKEKNRIGLSIKELEDSPWRGISEKIKVGDKVKAIVKRIVDYGAYVEILPGIDALLRNSELSWTLRIKNVQDLFNANQEIEVVVTNINEEKQTMAVSYKQTTDNPWQTLAQKYAQNTQHNGIVRELNAQGCLIRIADEIDGFMPRSKMRFNNQDKSKYDINSAIDVLVLDLDLEKENLILKPLAEESDNQEQKERKKEHREPKDNKSSNREKSPKFDRHSKEEIASTASSSSVTLADMLNDTIRQSLLKN